VTEAAGDVVVDQPAGLHKGVADSGADKLKTRFFSAFDSASEAGVVVGISASVAAGHLGVIIDEGPDKISERLAIFFHRQKAGRCR
jgi:hypothetical protein